MDAYTIENALKLTYILRYVVLNQSTIQKLLKKFEETKSLDQ